MDFYSVKRLSYCRHDFLLKNLRRRYAFIDVQNTCKYYDRVIYRVEIESVYLEIPNDTII